jgi:hypothetical protein
MRSDETHVKFRRGGSACEWNSLEPDGSRAVRIALMFLGSVDMPKIIESRLDVACCEGPSCNSYRSAVGHRAPGSMFAGASAYCFRSVRAFPSAEPCARGNILSLEVIARQACAYSI